MSKTKNGTTAKKVEENKTTVKKTTSKTVEQKPTIKKVTELDEIKRELEKIKQENEQLKKGKLKLSFADAQKMYLKKAKLIKDLRTYEDTKEEIKNISLGSPEDAGLLDYDDYKLTFERKDSYRNEKYITTSNKLIIKEFIPFIIAKLDKKISELKNEIETFEI